MRTLIILITGLLVVGCGKTDTERLEEENRRLKAQLENDKLKADLEQKPNPVKELTLREKVVGTYENQSEASRKFGASTIINTYRYVLLDNHIIEYWYNGKKVNTDLKWSIVNNELHIKHPNSDVGVYEINPDNNITNIAIIIDGKRKDYSKELQQTLTYKKIN